MSLFSSFKKQSQLDAAVRQTAQARKNEGPKADQLFKSAYQGFADVLQGDSLRAAALYNWGFALLHQAKSKTDHEAIKLYQDCISKFAFCMLIEPNYLAAAIDGGVAYMDLARLKEARADDELYDQAKQQFERANSIQAGSASYNLACIYGLRGDSEACLTALKISRDRGSLPDAQDILNDPDLAGVVNRDWFIEFMDGLNKKTDESSAQSASESVDSTAAETVE